MVENLGLELCQYGNDVVAITWLKIEFFMFGKTKLMRF